MPLQICYWKPTPESKGYSDLEQRAHARPPWVGSARWPRRPPPTGLGGEGKGQTVCRRRAEPRRSQTPQHPAPLRDALVCDPS